MKKRFSRFLLFGLAALLCALVVPVLTVVRSSPRAARADIAYGQPVIPHQVQHAKPRPHRTSKGVSRAHLSTLPLFSMQPQHASTKLANSQGALLSPNLNPQSATTIFFDNFESGAPGWTTVGDNNMTPYYSNGHDFWNLAQNPQTLAVPSGVNPTLVSYPDAAGALPSAYSGSHAWWYGDNPANDTTNPSGASITYMGNQQDWPSQTADDGGTSNGPNSASLISPIINLTSASNATLTFATWWEIESTDPANFDMMYVDASTNGGNTWTSIGVLNPTTNPAGGADPYPYTANGLDAPASWQTASVDLTPYVGSHVQLRFRFDSVDQYDNGFRGWLIDDVGIYTNTAGSPIVGSVTPDSGVAGDTVTITGSGFGTQQGSSSVKFNNVAASVQSWSNTTLVVTVPTGVTSGPLVVTVNGIQTGAIDFTIVASVALSSPTTSPQMVDAVNGQGFAPNEQVNLYLGGVTGTLLATATASAQGNLPSTNLTIPLIPAGNYLVLAAGQTSHVTAGTTLSIVPALASSPGTVKTSQAVTLNAVGYPANETVEIQFDNTNTPALAYLSCDNTGTCSGAVTMPSSSVVQGMHLLIGIGLSSATIAEAPVIFTPQVTNSLAQGGPGASLTLTGTAFAANETVQVYWGTTSGTLEGQATTDATGNLNFSFNAPTGLTPGTFTITIARSKQKPATLTTTYTVLNPVMTSTAGIQSGQPVTITLSGFQAYEQVNVSWNANGGQLLTSLNADYTGAATATFTPPSAPLGSYTLTAVGSSSSLQASSSLNIGPGILLTPSQGNPGATITVSGGGFTAGEKLNVYFQTTTNGIVTATTDATGAFTVPLTVPVKYKSTVTYIVHAVSTSSADKATANFSYLLPSFYSNYYGVTFGSPDTLYGYDFASNETVTLYWAYQQSGQIKVGTAVAASDGSFVVNLTVPGEPNLGYVTIAAIGGTSKLKVTSSVYEYAGLVLTPSSGPAGTKVKVSGGAFASAESVTVYNQGTSVGTVTTGTNGSFTLSFVVPTTQGIGYINVSATGATSGASASSTFTVTPKLTISPTTGPAGTTITVTGKNYSLSSYVYLYWYDPGTGSYTYFSTVNTSATGAFKTTIMAPSGLTGGNTYYVQAYDGPTNILAQAAFVAQ